MYQILVVGWLLGIFLGASGPRQYDCLPEDVKPDTIVSYARKPEDNLTVEKRLRELKARCDKKRLLDANGREIRFFQASCWGNPPPDYLEIQRKEKKQLEDLKKTYTVIVLGCNPRTA